MSSLRSRGQRWGSNAASSPATTVCGAVWGRPRRELCAGTARRGPHGVRAPCRCARSYTIKDHDITTHKNTIKHSKPLPPFVSSVSYILDQTVCTPSPAKSLSRSKPLKCETDARQDPLSSLSLTPQVAMQRNREAHASMPLTALTNGQGVKLKKRTAACTMLFLFFLKYELKDSRHGVSTGTCHECFKLTL
jgi:hypothetical protein